MTSAKLVAAACADAPECAMGVRGLNRVSEQRKKSEEMFSFFLFLLFFAFPFVLSLHSCLLDTSHCFAHIEKHKKEKKKRRNVGKSKQDQKADFSDS